MAEEIGKYLLAGTETLCSTPYWIYALQNMLCASFESANKASSLAERREHFRLPFGWIDIIGVTCFEFD